MRALAALSPTVQIAIARDGDEARAYLLGENPPPLPDLVLLDLTLPKLDGFSLLGLIRSGDRTRSVPVVVLTGSDAAGSLIRAYRLGASDYIRKPLTPGRLAEAAQHLGIPWLTGGSRPTAEP